MLKRYGSRKGELSGGEGVYSAYDIDHAYCTVILPYENTLKWKREQGANIFYEHLNFNFSE